MEINNFHSYFNSH